MTESAIACPQCATRLHLPPGNTATRFRCTQCGTVFDTALPAPPAPLPIPVPVPDFTAPALDDEDDDRPRRRRKRRDEDDEDDEPRRKPARREAKGGVSFALVALVGSVVLVAAAVGAYFAFRTPPKDKDTAKTDTGKDAPKPNPKNAPVLTPEQVVRKVKTSTVYVRTLFANKGATGSGFFAGKPGYVVTNAHVIGYGPDKIMVPQQVEVIIDSGETGERAVVAKVFAVDVPADLALLKIEGPNLPPPLAFGRADGLLETQEVVIYGYPFGEQLGKNVSINRTTVSSLRKLNGSIEVVQLAGGLNPGNSGGPVANAKGEIVGVSVAKLRGTDTIAFAIPAEIAQQFADEQVRTGGGFRLGELTPP